VLDVRLQLETLVEGAVAVVVDLVADLGGVNVGIDAQLVAVEAQTAGPDAIAVAVDVATVFTIPFRKTDLEATRRLTEGTEVTAGTGLIAARRRAKPIDAG
jgi:hypothetical protein